MPIESPLTKWTARTLAWLTRRTIRRLMTRVGSIHFAGVRTAHILEGILLRLQNYLLTFIHESQSPICMEAGSTYSVTYRSYSESSLVFIVWFIHWNFWWILARPTKNRLSNLQVATKRNALTHAWLTQRTTRNTRMPPWLMLRKRRDIVRCMLHDIVLKFLCTYFFVVRGRVVRHVLVCLKCPSSLFWGFHWLTIVQCFLPSDTHL